MRSEKPRLSGEVARTVPEIDPASAWSVKTWPQVMSPRMSPPTAAARITRVLLGTDDSITSAGPGVVSVPPQSSQEPGTSLVNSVGNDSESPDLSATSNLTSLGTKPFDSLCSVTWEMSAELSVESTRMKSKLGCACQTAPRSIRTSADAAYVAHTHSWLVQEDAVSLTVTTIGDCAKAAVAVASSAVNVATNRRAVCVV